MSKAPKSKYVRPAPALGVFASRALLTLSPLPQVPPHQRGAAGAPAVKRKDSPRCAVFRVLCADLRLRLSGRAPVLRAHMHDHGTMPCHRSPWALPCARSACGLSLRPRQWWRCAASVRGWSVRARGGRDAVLLAIELDCAFQQNARAPICGVRHLTAHADDDKHDERPVTKAGSPQVCCPR